MLKQIIIICIILILVFALNTVSESYTQTSVIYMNEIILPLREKLESLEDNDDNTEVYSMIEDILGKWKIIHSNMAYYIEHSELETFETDLISVKSFINSKEYSEAISDLDKSVYVLEHIKEKYILSIENVF